MHVRKVTKRNIRFVMFSVSAYPHGTAQLPLAHFCEMLYSRGGGGVFTEIYHENSFG